MVKHLIGYVVPLLVLALSIPMIGLNRFAVDAESTCRP